MKTTTFHWTHVFSRLVLFLIWLTCVVCIASAQTKCDAAFGIISLGYGNYQFSNIPTSPNVSYKWTVDGNVVSTQQSPVHHFNVNGVHTICLMLSSTTDSTCHDTMCMYLSAEGMADTCHAQFYSFTDTIKGETWFSNNSSPMTGSQFYWTFGDGTSSTTTSASFMHQYATAGNYVVCLTIINKADSCQDSTCKTIHVPGGLAGLRSPAEPVWMNKVYPLPFDNSLNLELNSTESGMATLHLQDLCGREVWTDDLQVHSGTNNTTLNMPGLAHGTYLLLLQLNGYRSVTRVVH